MNAATGLGAVLVVAFPNSVHTANWLRQVRGERPIVLVPATEAPPIAEIGDSWPVASADDLARMPPGAVGIWRADPTGDELPPDRLPAPLGFGDRRAMVRGATVARAITALRPSLVHSLEVQHAGYACLVARSLLGERFPTWLLSNWGSDIYLYARLAEHRSVLQAVAQAIDAALNECARDAVLLRDLGYEGPILPALPASGGIDFDTLPPLDAVAPPSRRNLILVKGYHGWAGRALHVLSAIHLAAPHLRDYRIRVQLPADPVSEMADLMRASDGLDIAPEPWVPDHGAAIRRMREARMMVACSISDGIGTTLLEAMALGAWPIVSNTCCAGEWLEPGRDGHIGSPHDVSGMAEAIRRAATDDALVDAAAPRNRATVEDRWNIRKNGERARKMYRDLVMAREGQLTA